MRPTLLDMTQEILSAMSSDEVNSISDTAESMQVATIIKRKFLDIAARGGLVEHYDLFKLEPSLDLTKPVLMSVPSEISSIDWIKYFNSDLGGTTEPAGYEYVTILPTTQFIDMVTKLNPNQDNVESFLFTVDINGTTADYTFYYETDKQPTYCTVIGNQYVVFDSYDSTLDSTLQQSKTMCQGLYAPNWEMEDTFVPELEDEQFPLLIAEAKTLAFFELKQMPHPLAEREIQRQWSQVSKNKSISGKPTYFDQLPDFGRTGSYNTRGWPFK